MESAPVRLVSVWINSGLRAGMIGRQVAFPSPIGSWDAYAWLGHLVRANGTDGNYTITVTATQLERRHSAR